MNLGQGPYFLQNVGGNRVIQSQHHHCPAAGAQSAHFHKADVNVVPAGHRADCADGSRLVRVVHEQHIGNRGGQVHPVIVDLDDVRLVAQGGAGEGKGAAAGGQGDGQQAGILRRQRMLLLGDLQPALLGQHRSVNQVYLLGTYRRQHPGQYRRFEHRRIVLGNLSLVGDGHAHKLVPGQVGQQLAHQRGHRDIGGQDVVGLRSQERGVDRVAGGPSLQHRQHLLGRFNSHFPLGFLSGGSQVRRSHDLGMGDQGLVQRRFLDKNVQGNPGQPVALQGLEQGVLVDQLSPGHVDQARSRFHQGQLPGANQVGGIGSERRMQRYKVGLG